MNAEYVDHMGNDLSVCNAARVSFAKTTSLVDGKLRKEDESLINYLAKGMASKEWGKVVQTITESTDENWIEGKVLELMDMATHWVPFTHTAITLRMKAPVPIRTQAFKHKQGLTESEESRRYISSRPELFIPDEFRSAAKNVKQGSDGAHEKSEEWKKIYEEKCNEMIDLYEEMIRNEVDEDGNVLKYGISPEQARFVLPQGVQVNWIWTGNLASYARFFNQRIDSHAQKESQNLAKMVKAIIEPLYPVSWKALTNGK